MRQTGKSRLTAADLGALLLASSVAHPAAALEAVTEGGIPEAAQEAVTEGGTTAETQEALTPEEILSGMTLDEKISQLIIPAIRTWDEVNVTDLSENGELAEALRRHQYGGVILFAMNISDPEQTARLVYDLQANNASAEASAHIPYLMPVDEEGGIVLRFASGTRMTGNMAIGAAGEDAEECARQTGAVLGEEMAALGFNADFAPVVDVNNNPENPVIGTRSFSDDPQTVAVLGQAFEEGLAENDIIGTYKHFPGHGDTVTDSHIGTPSIEKTYEQLQETELVPFAAAIENGADMIMTAHITFPQIDEEVTFGDGKTKGFYPATMSEKMIDGILRTDLGFDGVVVTDALEMDAIRTAGLVPGEEGSVEYAVNVAEKVINAGVDILLLPRDLNSAQEAAFYDDYIDGLGKKVDEGSISQERIDESVLRVLKMKEKYGILSCDSEVPPVEQRIENAKRTVGSEAHHEIEAAIAGKAVTLVKNEGDVLPLTGEEQHIVFLCRQDSDEPTVRSAAEKLREEGYIGADASVIIDYYFDPNAEDEQLHYTEDLKAAVGEADVVIALSKTLGLSGLAETSPQFLGMQTALEDTHAGGGRFIMISDNLPYDAARYQDADAIVLAYMGSGLDIDPTARGEENGSMGAVNANVAAAIETVFGANIPTGTLPVNLPVILEDEDGALSYGDEILYERGFGLTYDTGEE